MKAGKSNVRICKISNKTPWHLGGYVWSTDQDAWPDLTWPDRLICWIKQESIFVSAFPHLPIRKPSRVWRGLQYERSSVSAGVGPVFTAVVAEAAASVGEREGGASGGAAISASETTLSGADYRSDLWSLGGRQQAESQPNHGKCALVLSASWPDVVSLIIRRFSARTAMAVSRQGLGFGK